jgi:catalase
MLLTPRQCKYLAQLHNIHPDYAQAVYSLLSEPKISMDDVKEKAESAHMWYKEPQFRPDGNKLVGRVPSVPVYN